MTVPPLSMWLCIAPPDRRAIRVWLPLFLVWLLLLPIGVLLLIVAAVVDLAFLFTGDTRGSYTALFFQGLDVLASTRGLVVKIRSTHTVVDMTIR